jgi:hypothetical protein
VDRHWRYVADVRKVDHNWDQGNVDRLVQDATERLFEDEPDLLDFATTVRPQDRLHTTPSIERVLA